MTENTASNEERMRITRVLNAPRELVWKVWTDPDYAKQWWGPNGFTIPTCRMDLRVGGKFLFCMRFPDGQEGWTGGEYHEIIPFEKIVFSMYFADKDGNRVDPETLGIQHESIEGAFDVVTFEDLGDGKTRITYTGNEPMKDAAESGQLEAMHQSLDKLEKLASGLAEGK